MVAYTGKITYQQGGRCFDHTPASAVTAGDPVSQGKLLGVAITALTASEPSSLEAEGIFSVDKESTTDTYTAGQDVYWDSTNTRATGTPTLTYLGEATEAAAATATKVLVRGKFRINLPQPFGVISEAIVYSGFTDNGDATGYIDLSTDIPASSVVIGWKVVTSTGFTGDTTAVVSVGDTDVDRFSSVTTGSVLAAGTVGSQPKDGVNAFCAAATTPRVTVTGGADFGSISAGAATVYIYYMYFPSA